MLRVSLAGNIFVSGSEKLTRHILPETVTDDVLALAIAEAITTGAVRVVPRDDSGYSYQDGRGVERTPGRFAGKDVALAGGTSGKTMGKTGWNLSGTFQVPDLPE